MPTAREGPWIRGRIGLAVGKTGPQRLELTMRTAQGREIARWHRELIPPGQEISLRLQVVGQGRRRTAVAKLLDARGAPVRGASIHFGTAESHRRCDHAAEATTGDDGAAAFSFVLPDPPGATLVVAALRDGDAGTVLAYDMKIVTEGSR